MKNITSFYLSRVIGNRVSYGEEVFGKLIDLAVDVNFEKPKVVAALIRENGEERFYDFSFFEIKKEKGQYRIICAERRPVDINVDRTMRLVKHILDKQIVDINGRKVVRVNDVRLAVLSTGTYAVAVDIGVEGLLRRLGLAKPIKKFFKNFGKNITSKFILWDYVQPITSAKSDLKISMSYNKLYTLHPSDLADIIEDLDKKTQAAVFASLDDEKAADVLEELETKAQINVLESLPVEKAADVLEKMPFDEAADILDDINKERADKILNEMDVRASREIKELMQYPEHTVGSIMVRDFISFKTTFTVEDTIKELRRIKPDADVIYYLYVTDEMGKLVGVVSLRDLVIAEPNTPLKDIMKQDVIFVKDTDDVNSLIGIISKYSLLAVPVIDAEKRLIGVVIINDIVYELLKRNRRMA